MPQAWVFGSSPMPDWAERTIEDACMANVGLKPVRKLRRWFFRYFERQCEADKRRSEGGGHRRFTKWSLHTRVAVQDEMVEIQWSPFEIMTVTIPRAALVPATLTLLRVHDC